jgi:hypothetical protein
MAIVIGLPVMNRTIMRPSVKGLWTFSQPGSNAEGPPSKRGVPREEDVPAERLESDAAGEPGEAEQAGAHEAEAERSQQHGKLRRTRDARR